MRKIISSIIVSLDGFAAGQDGDLSMFKVDDEFFNLSGKLTEAADTALYGRGTYSIMQSYWPAAADKPNASKHDKEHSAWYNKVTKVVLSATLKKSDAPNATIIAKNVAEELKKIQKEAGKNIQIFGSPGVVRSLTQLGLIDEYYIFMYPTLIGAGIPLFNEMKPASFKLLSVKALSSGAAVLHYTKF